MRRLYYYRARGADGAAMRGSIAAESRDAAMGHLRARALVVTLLETQETARGALARAAWPERAGAPFFRSMAALVGSGIAVRQALETVMLDIGGKGLRETLASICADVEDGMALSQAIERHPREFGSVAIATLRAGEVSGRLDAALQTVADLEERNRRLRSRVLAALTYPTIVVLAAIALVAFLLESTMPAFSVLFAQLGVPLPATTRALLAIGWALRQPPVWLLLGAAAAATVGSIAASVRAQGRFAVALDRVRLALPLLGPVLRKSAAARFTWTLGSLLGCGVDVIAAIEAAVGVIESPAFRTVLREVTRALRRGESFATPFAASGLFDAAFVQVVRAGEESGKLDVMLLRIAGAYDADVETGLTAITSALEPLLVCVLGAVVATIVASIVIPLYTMIGDIK